MMSPEEKNENIQLIIETAIDLGDIKEYRAFLE